MREYSMKELDDYQKCPYKYKLTHIDKKEGTKGIYDYFDYYIKGILGAVYSRGADSSKSEDVFNRIVSKAEQDGVYFPNNSIGDRWKMDMRLFFRQFAKKDNTKHVNEPVRLSFDDYVITDIVDMVRGDNDGDIELVSWETSSRFMRDRVNEEGRKLIIRKLAAEETLGIEVDKVSWNMLRYVYVQYGNRKSIRNRRNWVAKTKNPIVKAINRYDSELNSEELFKEASRLNSLENLPKDVQEQFELVDCIIEYEFDDTDVENCLGYISSLVSDIEQDVEYNPVNIDKDTEFFCNMLCNHRETCKHIRIYKGLELSDTEKKVAELFG